MNVSVVNAPDAARINSHYISNRSPLLVNPLVKLPLGAVRPGGWLKHQLELMVDGMIGRMDEVSHFLSLDTGWFGGDGEAWEEAPYWLRGFYPMAFLTGDERCLALANKWIDGVIAGQDDDGYFGGNFLKRWDSRDGTFWAPDLWPHMIMLDVFVQHHEATGDERILPLLEGFFAWCRDLPDESFVPETIRQRNCDDFFPTWRLVWGALRSGDMLPHLYYLYNHTGQAWLLALATRFFHAIEPPTGEWLDGHIVNFTQRFAYTGVYYQQSHRPYHLGQTEFWYAQHMSTWGQQPRGIFGADECIRPGKVDARQGFETCGMTEYPKSFYLLGRATGDCLHADRIEDVLLNHFPASQTPDLKGLHYLTAANLPQLDAGEAHDFMNKMEQLSYSPGEVYRCCQHNVAMGWPWYAENLWQASADNGLAAWLYAACDVTAKVGDDGAEVTIVEETDYPFSGLVKLTVGTASAASFPLYLRVPRWCEGFAVSVNGKSVEVAAPTGSYLRIERDWADGDTVEIDMAMSVLLTTWPRTGAVTVDRGPLSYSVKIGEDWRKKPATTDDWPEWEVFPTTPWNYGLVVEGDPSECFQVVERGPAGDQPWTPDAAPIEIKAKARRIPNWQLPARDQTCPELQPSPIRSDQPDETITMIPLGCARLRMSVLPTVDDSPEAREWRKLPLSAKLRDAAEYERG